MTTSHRPRRRAALALAAGAAGLAGLFAVMPAGAAPEDLTLGMDSGQLSVGDQTFNLPSGGGFNGTLDDETGALSGSFSFPVITADITDPFPVKVQVTLAQQGAASGTVAPGGATDLAATVRIGLEIRTAAGALLVGGNCGIGPVSLTFDGQFDDAAGTLLLEDEGFVLPASSGCASPGIDFGPIIDDLLGGDTAASLRLSRAGQTTTSSPSSNSSTPTTPSSPSSSVSLPRPSTSVSSPDPTSEPSLPNNGPAPTVPGTRPNTTVRPSGVDPVDQRYTVVGPRIVDRQADAPEPVESTAHLTG